MLMGQSELAICVFISVVQLQFQKPGWGLGVGVSLPDSATLEMCTPCSVAMKPRMENTTKPAKKLVPLLMRASMMASLWMGNREALETACRPQVGRVGQGQLAVVPTCSSCC